MKKIYTLLLALGLLAFTSCQNEEEGLNSSKGYLRLSIGMDNSTLTKAEAAEATYNPKQLEVRILNEKGTIIKETDDHTTWANERFDLTPGRYFIQASSNGFDGKADWDKPYYTGADTVDIVAGKEIASEFTCKIANVLVTVEFDAALKEKIKSATVIVTDSANKSNTLAFKTNENSEKGKAYFPVTKLLVDLAMTNQKDVTNSKKDTIRDTQARDHIAIRYFLAKPNNGSTNITVTLDKDVRTFTYQIGVPLDPTIQTSVSSANAWAKFAYLEGTVTVPDNITLDQSQLAFEYKKEEDADWSNAIKVTTLEQNATDATKYTAKITGLDAGTKYQYRFIYGEGEGAVVSKEVNFTTEAETTLYNGGFDDWYQNGKAWYAIKQGDATTSDGENFLYSFWDSGNAGTATMSKNPTSPEETDVKNGKAVKLESQYVGVGKLGKFAAGNLYTGHYCKTYMSIIDPGARLRFGQPFSSRPTQLEGYYKYTRGTDIDYGSDPYKAELTASGGDQCAIYIVLTDNEGIIDGDHSFAYEIDNHGEDNPEKFIYKQTIDWSENNKSVIAYGSISEEQAKGATDWTKFTIDLKYRDLTRVPKYIVVVASASKYGDFFVGSSKSVMYVDEFKLIYGDSPKTE